MNHNKKIYYYLMQNPKEFDLGNYYGREVTHSHTYIQRKRLEHDYYSEQYYYDINGKPIDERRYGIVASATANVNDGPIPDVDMKNSEREFDHKLSAKHNIYMSYENYESLLCEVDKHKKEIRELRNEVSELKKLIK